MQTNKYLLRIIQWGLMATLFLPLVVSGSMFFPFITAKNFVFRTVIEILFVLWVILASRDKNYRPKKSLLLIFALATVGVLVLSTIFGADPARSFWSNYERMEGLIGHLHLLAYFLMLISVFKTREDWKIFFHVSLLASIFVGIYALLQLAGTVSIHQSNVRVDATLGNATYLAVYLLFHLFIALYYFLETKTNWQKFCYAVVFLLHAYLLYATATRGAILGFLGGIVLFGIIFGLFSREKRYRVAAVGVIVLIILLVSGFYLARHAKFVEQSPVLSRFAALSLSEQTTQSRLIIWGMALKGLRERPVLGWGLENFNLVFNKFYDPRLWKQEAWFDRAHNVIFDWLTAGGVLGLLSYLGLFVSAFVLLWKTYKRKGDIIYAGIFAALLAGYLFQNLFVFDQLISYMLFYAVLAYIHSMYLESAVAPTSAVQAGAGKSAIMMQIAAALAVVLFLPVSYVVNLKPYLQNKALIKAMAQMGAPATALLLFKDAISYGTFGDRESREQLAFFASQIVSASGVSDSDKTAVLNYSVSEMEKQIALSPQDARYELFLASIYLGTGNTAKARELLQKGLELSPNKQQILFAITQSYFQDKNINDALKTAKTAVALDTTYPEAHANLATLALLAGDYNLADSEISAAESLTELDITQYQKWGSAYASIKQYAKAAELYKKAIKQDPTNIQVHVSLAAVYYEGGDKENAIAEINKAIEINPDFKAQGEQFINQIRTGQKPK